MDAESSVKLISILEAEGYFNWTPVEKVSIVKEKIASGFEKRNQFDFDYDRYEEESILGSIDRRCYAADAEDLAEGGVESLLKKMGDLFLRLGLKLGYISTVNFDGSTYKVCIGGEEITLYSPSEADESWTLAPKRLAQFLNGKLAMLGTKERLYGRMGGNDLQIILMTPAMVTLVNKYMRESLYSFGDDADLSGTQEVHGKVELNIDSNNERGCSYISFTRETINLMIENVYAKASQETKGYFLYDWLGRYNQFLEKNGIASPRPVCIKLMDYVTEITQEGITQEQLRSVFSKFVETVRDHISKRVPLCVVEVNKQLEAKENQWRHILMNEIFDQLLKVNTGSDKFRYPIYFSAPVYNFEQRIAELIAEARPQKHPVTVHMSTVLTMDIALIDAVFGNIATYMIAESTERGAGTEIQKRVDSLFLTTNPGIKDILVGNLTELTY